MTFTAIDIETTELVDTHRLPLTDDFWADNTDGAGHHRASGQQARENEPPLVQGATICEIKRSTRIQSPPDSNRNPTLMVT